MKLNQLVQHDSCWRCLRRYVGKCLDRPRVPQSAAGCSNRRRKLAAPLVARFHDGIGIDDNFMKEAARALTPGQAALCVLVRKVTADKVLPVMAGFSWQGPADELDLTTEQEAKLQEALKA